MGDLFAESLSRHPWWNHRSHVRSRHIPAMVFPFRVIIFLPEVNIMNNFNELDKLADLDSFCF